MNKNIIITSLEEDFAQIGLTEPGESLDERRVARRRMAGGRVAKKTQRSSQAEKRASKSYYRAHKASILRRRAKRAKTAKGKRRMAWLRAHESNNPQNLTGILEDIQNIVSQIDEGNSAESNLDTAIRSFANIAIIAEMLGDFFDSRELSEEMEQEFVEDVESASGFFPRLAESAAKVATKLNSLEEDDEIAEEELEKIFQEQMDALVEGLEFYADLTEEDDEDEDDEDDEDEDEDDMEESVQDPSFVRSRMATARRRMTR